MTKNISGRTIAYLYIRNTILTNPNLVGQFLNERELAETLGISRTPVREAIMRLASEELIVLKPNRGAFIAPMTLEQINSLFQARSVIETWSATFCISQNIDPTPNMINEFEIQKNMDFDAPFIDFIEHDRAFHCALIDATGNSIFRQMYALLQTRHVTLGVRAMYNTEQRRLEVLKEHQNIIDALLEKNSEKACQAITHHLELTRQNLH